MFTEQGGAGQGAVEKSPLHRGPRTAAYRPLEPEKATESAWLTLLLKIHLIGWKLMADLQECSGAKPEWAGGSKCVCVWERDRECTCAQQVRLIFTGQEFWLLSHTHMHITTHAEDESVPCTRVGEEKQGRPTLSTPSQLNTASLPASLPSHRAITFNTYLLLCMDLQKHLLMWAEKTRTFHTHRHFNCQRAEYRAGTQHTSTNTQAHSGIVVKRL